jgi:hypothetical protein
MVEKAAVGRGRGKRSGKSRVVDQTAGMAERVSTPLSISLTRRSPWLTLLARCEVLKRHGVGERESEPGADFGSLRLPSCRIPVPITPGTRQMCPHNLP